MSSIQKMKGARLAPVDVNSIKLNVPMPFNLVDSRGVLLAQKGFVFQSKNTLVRLANHGNGFYVDFSDLSDPQLRAAERAYISQLQKKLRTQGPLGGASKVQVNYANAPVDEDDQKSLDWLNLIEACNAMLRTRDASFFNHRLENIRAILDHELDVNPDGALMVLFYLSEKDGGNYSATHCLLVCAICVLTAITVLHWSESEVDLLMRSALTMNIGMADLQDELIFQIGPTDISQQFLIAEHTNLAVQILEIFGVRDKNWLAIVGLHHKMIQKPLKSEIDSDRIIGLLNRSDIFAAKLAPRISRDAQTPLAAMKSIYLGAEAKPDDMGAAIIKAVGIYRPGSFVKLASGDVGLVIRRGGNTTNPAVVVVLNRDWLPVSAMAIRDTSDKRYAVTSSVPASKVKVTLNLERLLDLSRQ